MNPPIPPEVQVVLAPRLREQQAALLKLRDVGARSPPPPPSSPAPSHGSANPTRTTKRSKEKHIFPDRAWFRHSAAWVRRQPRDRLRCRDKTRTRRSAAPCRPRFPPRLAVVGLNRLSRPGYPGSRDRPPVIGTPPDSASNCRLPLPSLA